MLLRTAVIQELLRNQKVDNTTRDIYYNVRPGGDGASVSLADVSKVIRQLIKEDLVTKIGDVIKPTRTLRELEATQELLRIEADQKRKTENQEVAR